MARKEKGGEKKAPARPELAPTGFPIVGIGASAGGLAAFEAFFSSMPADSNTGMAFVLVQHLSPDHESILTELVKRYTKMQVYEVEDGMEVKPNCAYIIPPNRDMAFLNGTLQLFEPTERRGHRLPIDYFFCSLARDQRERAICIVLSGTGSDGTLGARAIKGEGGMVMAQSPESTQYDGMPRNVIGAGLVDYVLDPTEMPGQLLAYATHAFGKRPAVPQAREPDGGALRKICVLLRAQTGHDFSQYKENTLVRRVERRMAVQQIEEHGAYLQLMRKHPAETEALFRDLLIGVTSFFRDAPAFEALQATVIPALLSSRPASAPIRFWVCGCSTGEEAYSLGILLREQLDQLKQARRVQIFATDIDQRAIEHARAGVYPASIVSDVSTERLARYFSHDVDGGVYRIDKSVRDMLVFSEQSVIKDPPFSKLDLISCRNLLIYMNAELQKRVIPLFHYALVPGGTLLLGSSESVGDHTQLFEALDRKWKIYRRRDEVTANVLRPMTDMLLAPLDGGVRAARAPGAFRGEAGDKLRELTERTLLLHFAQVAVLVDATGDILHIYGRTGKFREPAPGDAKMNVLSMAREGLRRDLTTALHQAVTKGEPVCRPGLRVRTNGDTTTMDLSVRPAAPSEGDAIVPNRFLVIMEERPSTPATQSAGPTGDTAQMPVDARIAELEQELRAKEEYLQTTLEEMETTTEELKSTGEEMQSANEEMQSTNEELETSKEELQSVNEELSTVNAELQNKVADLSRANNDMNNLLAGTGVGTVFVDHNLKIARFTPSATRLINLIQSDVGRPVAHVVSNLVGYTTLVDDVRAVLDTLVPKEVEVRSVAGAWYLMRIQPYRTLDNVIEGAVITFVDITRSKQLEAQLLALNERDARGARDAGVVVFRQDAELRYTWVIGELGPLTADEMVGESDAAVHGAENAKELIRLKRGVIDDGVDVSQRVHLTLGGESHAYEVHLRALRGEDGAIAGVTGAYVRVKE